MFSAAGKSAVTSGYNINNSLRLRSSASAYLSRTPASAGNRKTFTISLWFKRGSLGSDIKFLSAWNADSDNGNMDFRITSGNILYWGPWSTGITTTAVFRDPSAWYHVVLAIDTTQATGANRHRIYVNGVEYTFSGTAVTQNTDLAWNNTVAHNIGRNIRTSGDFFDGYMADFYSIDGQALTPSSFGETDGTTGVWKPKKFGGSYGTNGFYLPFSDIATTSGSNAGLGKDFSGNGNYWTTNNISVTSGITYDAMTDVPTLTSKTVANYCAGNPLDVSVRGAFTNGNLTATCNGGGAINGGTVRLNTFNFTQLPVKWYWESTVTNEGGGRATFGMETTAYIASSEAWTGTAGWYFRADGLTNLTSPGTISANDVMMFAYDGNTGKFWVGKNGTWTNSGVPASGTGQNKTLTAGTEYWLLFNENTGGAGTAVCEMNYGQRPFAYTPPTDFLAVNTYNIPDSTIVKGNKYMDATLYTQNGTSTNVVTNAGAFRPDLVWLKCRSDAGTWHNLIDSVRGVSSVLFSNSTAAQDSYPVFSSFNSNGFTLPLGDSGTNSTSGRTQVAWQWQAGQGTTTVNTSGSISSNVSVNATAGFSVVTYTGTGSNATVGHGLGVAPKMVITKKRSGVSDWAFWITGFAGTELMELNGTAAKFTGATVWNSTTPTSTVFSVGSATQTNNSGGTYVAYLWSEIAGFSKFGSYTGNGSADGPFVYLGFRPEFLLVKRTDSTSSWFIHDTARDTYNVSNRNLYPNLSAAEEVQTTWNQDILSNGFKARGTSTELNASSGTYIYAAFAENPFKNALAR